MNLKKIFTVAVMSMLTVSTTFGDNDKDKTDRQEIETEIDNYDFLYNEGYDEDFNFSSIDNVLDEAFSHIGARYRSGHSGPFAFDCSGFTSYVFKNMFSMHVVGEKGEWSDYPLFPELFRKAGYHVTFLTNQFLPQVKAAVFDFSGGFFLNNPTLSAAQFDTRNSSLHKFDEDLLADYDTLKKQNTNYNLTIFHLIGQHVEYNKRYPLNRKRFTYEDYTDFRPELTKKRQMILADYDNATVYNDSILNQILKRFEDQNAIVVYVPDHGEECYEGNRGFYCRNHSGKIDYDLARYEFEIPFWIWASRSYRRTHPDLWNAILSAKDKPFMTDALPHLLLYLAGISAPDYHAEYNLLSPSYDVNRPRILKGSTDYNNLKPAT